MTNLDSILKSRDITLPTKIRLVLWDWNEKVPLQSQRMAIQTTAQLHSFHMLAE